MMVPYVTAVAFATFINMQHVKDSQKRFLCQRHNATSVMEQNNVILHVFE